MAKKTSDSNKRYEAEHTRNIARYQRQIEEIYKEAVREAASISSLIRNFSSDKPFKFVDYPITQQRVDKLLKGLKNGITTAIVNGIRHEWSLANTKNDELCNLVLGDSVESLSKSQYGLYFSANIGALEKFIDRKTDGLNLSDRVWNYTSQFKEEIEAGIGLGLMDGKTAPEMAKELKKYLKYPDKLFRRVRDERGILHLSKAAKAFHPGQGVYRSSYKNAMRLARTEVNMAYHEADYARWQNMDFVLGIEIKLSNNHTCLGSDGKAHEFKDICDKLAGRYPKDFKFTGWHPNCRCSAVTILKTIEEMAADKKALKEGRKPDPNPREVKDVPPQFKEWVTDNVERISHANSLPYFIKDNDEYVSAILDV